MRGVPLVLLLVVFAPNAWAQPTEEAPRVLPTGGWVAGELTLDSQAQEADSSFFDAYRLSSDGGPFEVRLLSRDFDGFLFLLSPSGHEYAADDYGGSTAEARLTIAGDSTEAGAWKVLANALYPGAVGAYELAHRPLTGPLGALNVLPEGGWVAGSLTAETPRMDDSTHAREVPFVSDGGPFEVRLLSSDFDPFLLLRSPSGRVFENDDHDGSVRESRLFVTPGAAEAGSWVAIANTYAPGATGDFALTHRPLTRTDLVEAEAAAAHQELARAASLLARSASTPDGLPLAREALALRRLHLPPSDAGIAEAALAVALLLHGDGETDAARNTLAQATEAAEAAGASALDFQAFLQTQARLADAEDDVDRAAAFYERALDLVTPPASADSAAVPPAPEAEAARAVILFNLADVRLRQGAPPSAGVALLREALALEETLLDADDLSLALTLAALGDALRADSAYAEAREHYARSLASFEAGLGPDHPSTATLANALGEAMQLEAYAEARPLYARAAAAQEAVLGADHELVVRARNNLERLRLAEANLLASAPPAPQLRGPDVAVGPSPLARRGHDRALLFAVNQYDDLHFDPLSNPLFDAETLAGLLQDSYGFETSVIRNPTRGEILDALREARTASPPENSQFFVFFAGHGVLDGGRERGLGYLIPRDAVAGDFSTYVSYSEIGDNLEILPDQRVLAVFDACYGGAFFKSRTAFRGDDPPPYEPRSLARIVDKYAPLRARLALTSGQGDEPVSEGVRGQHSPFAYALISALRNAGDDGLVTFEELKTYTDAVEGQSPGGGPFGYTEPGATFFFLDPDLAGDMSRFE